MKVKLRFIKNNGDITDAEIPADMNPQPGDTIVYQPNPVQRISVTITNRIHTSDCLWLIGYNGSVSPIIEDNVSSDPEAHARVPSGNVPPDGNRVHDLIVHLLQFPLDAEIASGIPAVRYKSGDVFLSYDDEE